MSPDPDDPTPEPPPTPPSTARDIVLFIVGFALTAVAAGLIVLLLILPLR
ncbi:hypothetical protein [Deinococcus yunweiensis]